MLIAFGAMHGNEPAGVNALKLMFKMLEVEPITNPDFLFKGRLLGLIGNLRATQQGVRYLERDLNRQWTVDNIKRVKSTPTAQLQAEDLELKEVITLVEQEIEAYQPDRVVVLDLHTTTAHGGIFSIPTEEKESIRIALELHAPVIKGLLRGIQGTSLHYFNSKNFDIDMVAVCFESGQHQEQLSVNRAIAAITNCMRTIGCVLPIHIENQHDALLIEYSKDLPQLAELIEVHRIGAEDKFEMLPNYKNFQIIEKGEQLAKDKNGPIKASEDGLILMPLYQKQGDDGFFLIRTVIDF